jgi:allantoin racemase
MRIYCQLPVRMPRADKRFSPYYTLVEKHYGLVKRKDTEITIRDVKGFDSPEWTHYTGLRLFNDAQILKSLIAAEQEGFDGISIACFLDPALYEARQLLTIPVTGLAESSLHLACMMGNKFAIITSSERFIPAMEENIYRYGVQSKAISRNPVRALVVPEEELIGSSGWIKEFQELSQKCIEDGAEVLVAGCGLMSPALIQARVTEVNGAAIIDPVSVSLKLTEAMVDLQKAKLPVVSRKSAYSEVSRKAIEAVLASMH